MLIKTNKGRVLGFDIENMPLTYYAPDYPTSKVTVIGMAFEGEPKKDMHVCIVDPVNNTGCTMTQMYVHFIERYEEATLVTGHYIRKHDLPTINGMLFEEGYFGGLSAKMTSDTKDDLPKWRGLPKNLEFLLDQLEVRTSKKHMTQYNWRAANTFTEQGLAAVLERSKTDVIGQLQVRRELIDRGYLKAPRLWRP